MSNPLQQTIEALAKEKGIEPDVVISAIEEAVATASRKYYKTGENLKTRFNTETGQVDLFALKTVVEAVTNSATEIALNEAREMYRPLYGDEVANSIELGDEMEFPKPTEVLGRIAAQTAKQVIVQKVREAERAQVVDAYKSRKGELISGTVKRVERGNIILDLGNNIEALVTRDHLIARVAEARLQMLAMQLQPHFLFNTINTGLSPAPISFVRFNCSAFGLTMGVSSSMPINDHVPELIHAKCLFSAGTAATADPVS